MSNIFTGLWGKLKNYIFPQAAVQKVFDVSPIVSQTMEQNINLWYAMWINQPPWATPEVIPIGLPGAICREIARPVLVEFKANITGSKRADYINACFQEASEGFIRKLEIGLAIGGIAFKPYIYGDRILIDATSAAAFQPIQFDASGACIGGVFRENPVKRDGRYYIRLEYHNLDGTTYTIANKAFKSDASGLVGEEVSLAVIPEWEDIQPEITIQNLSGPLFSYFKVPLANTADTASQVGVSVYSGATVDLIRQADEQWRHLRWEFSSGKRKIFLDGTETDVSQFDQELYVYGAYSNEGNFFKEFSPEFRDEPLYRGLQNILKQIEFQVGLSYGTISDPIAIEKTATEIRASKQRMYVTVDSVQKALQHTFDGLIYAMDVYATLYNLAPAGIYEISYDWGDSTLDDADAKDKEFARDLQLLSAGIMNDWEFRAKWMNEDESTAKAALPKMKELTTEPEEEIE